MIIAAAILLVTFVKFFVLEKEKNIPSPLITINLPEGLEAAQIEDEQLIDGIYFAKFLKGNINTPVDSSVSRSGIITRGENEPPWRIFFEIEDLTDNRQKGNNPVDFWKEDDGFYAVLANANGAGSGEGNGKLIFIDPQTKSYKIKDCFYYAFDGYLRYLDSLADSTMAKSKKVISYNNPYYPDESFIYSYWFDANLNKFKTEDGIEEDCTSFKLLID